MRKILIAALFATTLPALALAMPEGPDGKPPHRGPDMFQTLDLSKEQRREIGQLMGKEMKSRHEITDRYLDKLSATDKQAMEKELTAARESTQNAIRASLTPEQQKTFDAEQKKREARRAEMAEFKAWKAEREQSKQ